MKLIDIQLATDQFHPYCINSVALRWYCMVLFTPVFRILSRSVPILHWSELCMEEALQLNELSFFSTRMSFITGGITIHTCGRFTNKVDHKEKHVLRFPILESFYLCIHVGDWVVVVFVLKKVSFVPLDLNRSCVYILCKWGSPRIDNGLWLAAGRTYWCKQQPDWLPPLKVFTTIKIVHNCFIFSRYFLINKYHQWLPCATEGFKGNFFTSSMKLPVLFHGREGGGAIFWLVIKWYRLGPVHSKSFIGKVFLWIRWKFDLQIIL